MLPNSGSYYVLLVGFIKKELRKYENTPLKKSHLIHAQNLQFSTDIFICNFM